MARTDEPPADRARRLAGLDLARRAFGALSEGTIDVSDSSQSMAPILWGGERIFWKRLERPVRRGDLVVFVQASGLIVHRAMGSPRNGFLATKGDNRPSLDQPPIALQDVLGVVVYFERDGRRISLATRTARYFAVLAWGCSACGSAAHRLAAGVDSALRGFSPGTRDRWVLRAPAFWLQRMGQRLLHAALFRVCHPPEEIR